MLIGAKSKRVFILVRKLRLYTYCWWLINKSNFTIKGILNNLWGWVRPYFTLKMIPILLSLWLMTNGIWYMIGFVPFTWVTPQLRTFARLYLTFLYTPIALEKPVILLIAKPIYKALYKNDFVVFYEVRLLKKCDYKKNYYKEVKV